MHFEIENDLSATFDVDPNRFAKEMGKFENLGKHSTFGYMELAKRVQSDYENLIIIQKKKEKSQQAYEDKNSNVRAI